MHWTLTREHRDFARTLRRNATPPERALWALLRKRQTGAKFRRQAPLGPYVVDFLSHDLRLVIELDDHSHSGETAAARDAKRDVFIRSQGFEVIRLANPEVYQNPDGIWRLITDRLAKIEAPSP